ncbi:hypothetical protein PG995_009005 [Apiospora arundinis]
MLQPWLYFGLLSVVTDEPFTIQDFTRLDDDGNSLLTSDCLESLVTRWSNKIASQPWSKDERQFREWYKRLEMYLLRAREIVLWTKHGDASPYKRFDTVVMSIAVLGEYLSEALYDLFREREWETPVIQSWRSSEVLDCGKPLRKIMRHNGWCPYKIVGLDSNWTSPMSVSSLWFFANLAAPKADEHIDGAGRGLLCNSSVCHFMDVKKAQYVISHQVPHCSCEMVSPNQSDLASALQGGTIPIITLQALARPEQFTVHCTAEPYTSGMQYVAISHVWANGHGNPYQNMLPTCILAKLAA